VVSVKVVEPSLAEAPEKAFRMPGVERK
jgi:hypothetical protein